MLTICWERDTRAKLKTQSKFFQNNIWPTWDGREPPGFWPTDMALKSVTALPCILTICVQLSFLLVQRLTMHKLMWLPFYVTSLPYLPNACIGAIFFFILETHIVIEQTTDYRVQSQCKTLNRK